MASKSGTKKPNRVMGKVLSVVLCAALLGTTYAGFFKGLGAAASAVDLDALASGEVGINKTATQWVNSDGSLGRGADVVVKTAARPIDEEIINTTIAHQVLDVVVIIDTSGSMSSTSEGKTILDSVKIAAKDLANTIYGMNSDNRLSLVSFAQDSYAYTPASTSGTVYTSMPSSGNYWFTASQQSNFNSCVDGLSAVGGTNSEGGLLAAKKVLDSTSDDRNKLVVFMTDGLPTGRYKDNGTKINSVATYDGCGNGIPNYEELSEMLTVADSISLTDKAQLATVFYSGGLTNSYDNSSGMDRTSGFTGYFKGCTNSTCGCNTASKNHGTTALVAPASATTAEQRLMSGFYHKFSLSSAEYIVNDLLKPFCAAGVYMPSNASEMLKAFKDIITSYTTNNHYDAATNAYYDEVIPDYLEVIESSVSVSMGTTEILKNTRVEVNGQYVNRDVLRWTIGTIPEQSQTLSYSLKVKDDRAYGIMDVSLQGKLTYDEAEGYTQTHSPLIVQIDEITLPPKGTDDYYVAQQQQALDGNVKNNDDPLNVLYDYSGNSADADTIVNGYISGLNGNVDKAHLSPYTTELINGPQYGSVKLNSDGSFTYTQDPGLYATEVSNLSPDANGTDEYNGVTVGWEDTFTYRLHTDGYSTKYIYETIAHTSYNTYTVQEGMSFEDVNSVAGDKFCMLIFEDVNQTGADSEGRVIIGGDLNVNGGWAVSNLTNYGDDYALLVGGRITGSPNVSGRVSQGEEWVREYVKRAKEAFTKLSKDYSELPADGISARNQYYTPSVELIADSNHQAGTPHVFYVDGNDYIQQVTFKGNFGSDQIIINISGVNHNISGGQWAMFQDCNLNESALCSQATWNFYQATKLTTSSFSFKGSVLAPLADFTGSNGHIEGTLIAKSATGLGGFEYHAKYFFFDTTGKSVTYTEEVTTYETKVTQVPISLTEYGQNTTGRDSEADLESTVITAHIRIAPKLGEFNASKNSDPAPGTTVKSGDTIEYTINVANPSYVPVSGVVITDVLPLGTSLVDGTISDGGAIDSNGKITWTLDFPANGNKTVSFKVRVNDNVTGINNLSNVALVTYTLPGSEEPSTTSTNVVNHALLSAVKSSSAQGMVKIGDSITYTITVTNHGSAASNNVVVTDNVPEGLSFVSSDDFTVNAGVATATIPVIGPGESKSVAFTVSVDEFGVGVREFRNTAAVNDVPTNTTEDIAKRGDVVVYYREAGTEIDLADSTGSEGAFGDSYGPYAPIDITNYRYVNVVGSPSGSYTDGTITVIFYYEKIPASAIVKYVDESYNEIDTPLTYNGFVGDTLEEYYGRKDTIGNYTYIRTEAPTYTLTEEGIVIIHVYKLNVDETLPTVVKSADPVNGSLVKAGDYITYTISVTNNKYEAMNDVIVTDNAPVGTSIIAADGAQFDASSAQWTIPTIAAGATASVYFTVVVDRLADSGNLSNIAKISYYDREATTPTELTTNVVNHAVLTAEKYSGSNERGYYGVGDTITYFIKVKNVGSADATGIRVTDEVPAGTTLASGDTNWTFDLKAGAEKIVSFAVTVNDIDAYNAVVNNTAYVNDTPTNTTEDLVKKGDVVVKYQDEEGNPLHEDTFYEGTPGDAHGDTGYIEIPNYTYKTTEGTTTGKFIEGRITIIHIYNKTPAVAIVKYLDIDTLAPIDASQTINGLAGEPIESDLFHEIENWQFIKTEKPEMIFTVEGVEIIHYYRFIKPDDTTPELVKASNPASGTAVKSGETVTYTITFTNTRIDPINDIVITDVLPMGSTLIEGSISGDGYLQNRTVRWNIGTLQPGESAKVNFAVIVNNNLTGSGNMANTATATFTDRDRNPNEPLVSNTTKHPIILASKDHSNTQPDAILTEGDKITYTITVNNVGSEKAIDVPVEDIVPAGTSFVSSPDMICTEGVVRATIPELVPGTPVVFSFTVVIDKLADGVYGEKIPNVAKVSDVFTNEVEDEAMVGYVLVRHWDYDGTLLDDFTVSKSGRVGTSYGTYVDLVTSGDIANRTLREVIGDTTGNFIPGLVNIDFYYDRIPVTLTVKYLEKGTDAEVKQPENYDGFFRGEAVPAQYAERVEIPGWIYLPDDLVKPDGMIFDEENEVIIHYYERILDTDRPEIIKSSVPASGSIVNEGNTITYNITVKNPRKTDALQEAVVTDTIPVGTTFVSADNEGAYDTDTNAVTWNLGSIPAGQSKTVSFKVKVDTGITSGINLANQAAVTYKDIQTGETNTVPSNVTTHALIVASKATSNAEGNILYNGDMITYTVTARNVGSAPAEVTIVDAVPEYTRLISGTVTTGATITGDVITYKIASLEPGATATLKFSVKVVLGDKYSVDIKNKATVNDIPTNETVDRAQRGTVHTRYFLTEPDGITTEVTDYDNGIGYRNEGKVGTPVNIPANKTFENYRLTNVTRNSDSDVYIPGDIEVCYYFERIPVKVTILYKDIDTLAQIADTRYFGENNDLFAGDTFPSIYKQSILHYEYVENDAPTKTVVDEYGKTSTVPDLLLSENGLVITHYYRYIVDSTEIVRVKSADPASDTTVKPGQEITYTITVENPRYDAINSVVVTDAIPAGTSYVDGTASDGGVLSNGALVWQLGTMEAKASANLTFTVKVDESFSEAGNLANQAVINYSDSLGEPQKPVETNTVNHSVLKFSKEVSKTEANVGDELVYTIKVMNYGSVPAESVVITDAIPEGTVFVPGSISDGGRLTADGNVTWSGVKIGVGVETVFSFSVVVEAPADGAYSADIVNTAYVNDEPTNETLTKVTLGTVTVTHVDDKGNVLIPTATSTGNVGDEFAFQPFDDTVIYGYNHVKTTVDGKEISTPEASGSLIEGNIDIVFVYTKGEGVLTVRYLEKETLETLHPAYTEVFEIGTHITDLHEVDLLPYYELVPEDTVYNPEDLVMVREGVEIIYYYIDIPDTTEILRSKTSDPEPRTILWPGDEVTYTIDIENPRREKIDNIVVSDPVPAGTEIVEGSISDNGQLLDGVIYWNIESLAIGEKVSFSFTVKVNEAFEQAGNVENTAHVTFTNRKDTEPVTYDTNTVQHPVLIAKKSVDKTEVNVGDEFEYTIEVTNYGSVDAVNVVITDDLPEGVSLVPENKPAYTFENKVLTWNVPKIEVGQTETFTFIVKAHTLPTGIYRDIIPNTAKVNDKDTNTVETTVVCGVVTILHVDEEGNVLIEKDITVDKVGTPYKFSKQEIEGYEYKETQGEAEGEIVEGETNVVMVYKKGNGTLTVRYLDEDTNETIHDSYTETMEIGEKVKDEHKEDIENYTYTKTDKPDDLTMVKDGLEIIHYYKHTPPTYTVEGKAWSTEDSNSKYDKTDTPYSNLPVVLKDSSDKVVSTATTDQNGDFKFEDVLAGNYVVEYNVPTEYEVSPPLAYSPNTLNSCVTKDGITPVTVDDNVKNIGMELYKTKVLGANDVATPAVITPVPTYTNQVETVKVYQPVEPAAEKVNYTRVLGDTDTPHTGDDGGYGATIAMLLASASLFILILCRRGK